MNRQLCMAAFGAGLAAVAWVAYGYLGSNPLALLMTALIGAFYLMGALELRRFQQATAGLQAALQALPERLPSLAEWLGRLDPALQNPVRLRIEGERVGLPGPAMTPYLVGLLVLLGMLGTFLGMVVTLNGAVLALESTTDLPTIRAALAAPVKGLGLAFGTSVAGVAASAMLGLMSALCRRERLQAVQALDARSATTLHEHTAAHQRQQTLATLQSQSRALPEVMVQLQATLAQMQQHSSDLHERLLASQERFHGHAQASYQALASSVDDTLKHSLTESARAAGATIRPVVEATLTGIARESAAFQEHMAHTVQQQLEGLSTRFGSTVATVADTWTSALLRHERTSEAVASGLQQSLDGFNQGFEQRAAALLARVEDHHAAWQGELAASLTGLTQQTTTLHERVAHTAQQQFDGAADKFTATAAAVADRWQDALATVDRAHARLQADAAASDQQRLAAWTASLQALAQSLQQEWQQAGSQALGQQQQICRTLEQTARDMQAQAQAQARDTIAEVSRLIETASEAPRAAAEVVGLLRQKLSDSLVRDNELLDERSRIMATLGTLLEAVNGAATEQRAAIDALVQSSAAMLQQAGVQFSGQIEAESTRLAAAAAQVTGSAVDVSSLGEAFGAAVQMFSESSEALTAHLQRIEGALGKSTARSDEQLAYYVAQAREIIDLSISSQKQIVEDLQQLAIRRAPLASEVA